MKKQDGSSRRDLLKAAGAGLVAAAVPAAAEAAGGGGLESVQPKPVYLWGCGWNRDLPGPFGDACLTFDVRATLNGTGVGTFRDDVNPDLNSQWRVDSATRHGNTYTLKGEIISARDAALVGLPVKIVAKKTGDGTASADIMVGSEQSLVVIAIIAILIGLLVPQQF